jgi:hypothetical protein
MNLEKLTIERMAYGPKKGHHVGEIKFAGESGAVTIVLSADHIARLMAVVADAVVGVAKEAAQGLVIECQAVRAIEAQP